MKKILCYGDSNTYGYIPETCGRYEQDCRWSGLLKRYFPNYKIIEEGMNNRCGFFKNPSGLKQSGGEYLPVFLQNHKDIDICILNLGTNDAQFFYELDGAAAEQGLNNLINSLKDANQNTKIIICAPVKITENILRNRFSIQFNKESIERIKTVFPVFKRTAQERDCLYFDFNKFVNPSEIDGLHYSAESHKIIAKKLAEFILEYAQ